MTTRDYLQVLRNDIRSTTFATIGADGHPQTRIIDVMLVDDVSLYFITARGKEFHTQITEQRYVSISGVRNAVAVSLRGKIRRADPGILGEVFRQNPFLADVYPGETRSILEVFQFYEGQGEYFDLNRHPIFRDTFVLGGAAKRPTGYRITDACTGCGACVAACPQNCIDTGTPFRIRQQNCLHCGRCAEACPSGAVCRAGDLDAARAGADRRA